MYVIIMIVLFLLAAQNLVTVTSYPVFITVNTRPARLWPKLSNDELTKRSNNGLVKKRFDHLLKTEWMQRHQFFCSVLVKEGINNCWYDYIDSMDNLDVVNAVKNRKAQRYHTTPTLSTTEYSTGGFQLHEGTHHLLPLLFRILVGNRYNNNNTANSYFIAVQLTSSLAHATLSGENLLRHDHSRYGEKNIAILPTYMHYFTVVSIVLTMMGEDCGKCLCIYAEISFPGGFLDSSLLWYHRRWMPCIGSISITFWG